MNTLLIITSCYQWQQVLIGAAIGPKVNLHYRLLLSSVLLIPLLSVARMVPLPQPPSIHRLHFLLQALASA